MSEHAVVCPHCGTRQKDRDPIKDTRPKARPLTNLTKEEAAALLATQGADKLAVEGPRGFVALILPHPASQGWVRLLEIACLLASAPVLVSGVSYYMISVRVMRRANRRPSMAIHLGTAVL